MSVEENPASRYYIGIVKVFEDEARRQPLESDILTPAKIRACENDLDYVNPSICGPAQILLNRHQRAVKKFGLSHGK